LFYWFCMGTEKTMQKNVPQITRHCYHYVLVMYRNNYHFRISRSSNQNICQSGYLYMSNHVANYCVGLVLSKLYSICSSDSEKLFHLFLNSICFFSIRFGFHIDSDFTWVWISHRFGFHMHEPTSLTRVFGFFYLYLIFYFIFYLYIHKGRHC
jgi:hypothetical protein